MHSNRRGRRTLCCIASAVRAVQLAGGLLLGGGRLRNLHLRWLHGLHLRWLHGLRLGGRLHGRRRRGRAALIVIVLAALAVACSEHKAGKVRDRLAKLLKTASSYGSGRIL